MNKVEIAKKTNSTFIKGDIFISHGDSTTDPIPHILCYLNDMWVAVSLIDGHYWDYPNANVKVAVKNLQFVGRNMKITLSHEAGE